MTAAGCPCAYDLPPLQASAAHPLERLDLAFTGGAGGGSIAEAAALLRFPAVLRKPERHVQEIREVLLVIIARLLQLLPLLPLPLLPLLPLLPPSVRC
jgi:hypothetical protein